MNCEAISPPHQTLNNGNLIILVNTLINPAVQIIPSGFSVGVNLTTKYTCFKIIARWQKYKCTNPNLLSLCRL